jgi:hypothetical protein
MATTPADQLTIRGNTDNNKRLLLGFDTTANKASLQSYTAASTAGPLLLNPGGGNVGVGKLDPSVAFDVTGAIKASTSITSGTSMAANGTNGYTFAGTGDTDGGLFSSGDGSVSLKTDGIDRINMYPSGAVIIPATSSFSVNGWTYLSGNVMMGSGTGTSEPPNRGTITRRVNTTANTLGRVVATSSGLQVIRDGTNGGMRVKVLSGGNNTVFYKIYNESGSLLRSVNFAQNSQTADIQLCTDAERASRIEMSFGDVNNIGEWTDLTLSRHISNANASTPYWIGFMTSTVNQ